MAAVGGEIGEAHVTLRMEMARYEADLARARSTTTSATADMGRSVTGFSRNSRAAFQNAGFQVQDFLVQIQGGQGVLRAFIQQGSQFASAFGPIGIGVGLAVTALGTLASVLFSTGESASDSEEKLKALSDQLQDLAERYRTASGAARDFIEARQTATTIDIGRGIFSNLETATSEYADSLVELQEISRRPDFSAEQTAGLLYLIDQFADGTKGAQEFREELNTFASQMRRDVNREGLRELGDAAIAARDDMYSLQQSMRDLATGVDPENLEKLRQKVADLRDEAVISALPPSQRDAAKAASDLGVALTGPELEQVPESVRAIINEYAALTTQLRATEAAERASTEARSASQANLDKLQNAVEGLRTQLEITDLPAEMQSIAKELARLGIPVDVDELNQLPPAVRALVDEYVALAEQLRDVEAANKAATEAESLRLKQLAQEHDALAQSFTENPPAGEAQAETEIDSRIESGSRLPDQIDAANIAAAELSATLVDINNLSFASLAAAFADITQQIIQAIIQALIFRAITGAIGGVGGTAGASASGAAATGAHGLIMSQGRVHRLARGGFITDRPMLMPMASGAALIGEAGPEAVLPLKRMASGDLGVATEGGYGRNGGSTINIDARQSQPGTVATAVNLASRIAPGAVVNAQARGMSRSGRPPF